MNGKSSIRTHQFRPGTSQSAEFLSTFRQQMADFARGEQIRGLREARHLSQEDTAHEVGVSTKTLRNWEQGGKIKWENAKKLAAFYKVEPDTLVSRELDDVGLTLTTADVERLKKIEEKLDEILERLRRDRRDEEAGDGLPPEQPPPLPESPPKAPAEPSPRRRGAGRRRAS